MTYSGTQSNVYVTVETVYGTTTDPASTTKRYDRVGLESNCVYSIANNSTPVYSLGSQACRDVAEGPGAVSGSIDFQYHSSVPFHWILGATVSSDVGAPYTWVHTDAATQDTFSTTVVQDGSNDTDYQLNGCVATGLSFSMDSTGTPATGTLNFVGQDADLSGVTTPTTVTVDDAAPWNMINANVEIPDGSDITTATGFSMDLSRTSAQVHSLGSRVSRAFYSGTLAITGAVDFYVADAADAADIVQQVLGIASASAIQSSLTKTTLTVDRGYTDTTADTWEIDLNGVTLDTADLNFPLATEGTYSIGYIAEDIQVQWEAPVDADTNWS